MQQFLQQSFAEIGVEMTISNLPAAVMWGEFWLKSQFDSAIAGVTYLIAADPDVTNRLHTSAIAAKGGKGSNTGQYSNPEVDALLEKGARTFDPEARRAIYSVCRKSSVRTCRSCRCLPLPTWSGARKGSKASSRTPTPAPHPGMPRDGIGRADVRRRRRELRRRPSIDAVMKES